MSAWLECYKIERKKIIIRFSLDDVQTFFFGGGAADVTETNFVELNFPISVIASSYHFST